MMVGGYGKVIIYPGENIIPDETTNNELFLGQFMDLSGDGSRLITTGTSFNSEELNYYGTPVVLHLM